MCDRSRRPSHFSGRVRISFAWGTIDHDFVGCAPERFGVDLDPIATHTKSSAGASVDGRAVKLSDKS